jgi:hypothetical protein
LLVTGEEKKETERQKILDRLNSYDELNDEARQKEKESERKRLHEREMEIERSKRSAGI